MVSGIYAYWDNVKNYYVYVGRDNQIDQKYRHYTHIAESKYDQQQINKVLQNNSERYEYRVIMEGDYNNWELNQMEKLCIKSFKTFKEKNPEKNVFNFTEGGDGFEYGENNPMYRDDLNDDEIIDLYINKNLSTLKIADKLNSNNETIRRRLIKNNIKLRDYSEVKKGNNNPYSKYTIWNISNVEYNKTDMFKNNGGDKPKKIFLLKYNEKRINIGGFIDFTTPEIIHNLICEAIDN